MSYLSERHNCYQYKTYFIATQHYMYVATIRLSYNQSNETKILKKISLAILEIHGGYQTKFIFWTPFITLVQFGNTSVRA